MHRVMLAGAALLMLGTGCLPYQADAPVGRRDDRICQWVRDRVADGSLPLDLAREHYPQCEPLEKP